MPNRWIHIVGTKYLIKGERLNWIVGRKVKCKKSKCFPEGWKVVDYTYHPELDGAFKRIFDETVRLAPIKTIEDLLRVCEETYQMLREVLKRDFKDE